MKGFLFLSDEKIGMEGLKERRYPFTVWSPVADGEYFVGNPLVTGFRKETENIPVIVGSCVCEFIPSLVQ